VENLTCLVYPLERLQRRARRRVPEPDRTVLRRRRQPRAVRRERDRRDPLRVPRERLQCRAPMQEYIRQQRKHIRTLMEESRPDDAVRWGKY
jgi:hypothetical protein